MLPESEAEHIHRWQDHPNGCKVHGQETAGQLLQCKCGAAILHGHEGTAVRSSLARYSLHGLHTIDRHNSSRSILGSKERVLDLWCLLAIISFFCNVFGPGSFLALAVFADWFIPMSPGAVSAHEPVLPESPFQSTCQYQIVPISPFLSLPPHWDGLFHLGHFSKHLLLLHRSLSCVEVLVLCL